MSKKKYSLQTSLEYSKNKELLLKHRISINGLAGYDLIHKYRSLVYFGTGLNANSELYTDNTKSDINVEWMFQLNMDFFKRTHPEIYFSTFANIFPSLTIKGRYRINSTAEIKIEVLNNFYIGFQLYDDFDNKPHGENTNEKAQTNDFGINGTVTYSFH